MPLQAKTVTLNVQGMMCESCAQSVTDGFMDVEGVTAVQVDLEDQTVTIDMDDQHDITDQQAAKIMTDRGYVFQSMQVK